MPSFLNSRHTMPSPNQPDPNELVQYLVVNQDLGMSPGKMAAQAAHAATLATLAGMASQGPQRTWFDAWLAGSKGQEAGRMKKIVLGGSAAILEALAAEGGHLVIDAGYTEIPAGSPTVVALPPMPRYLASPLVSGLRLFKESKIKV